MGNVSVEDQIANLSIQSLAGSRKCVFCSLPPSGNKQQKEEVGAVESRSPWRHFYTHNFLCSLNGLMAGRAPRASQSHHPIPVISNSAAAASLCWPHQLSHQSVKTQSQMCDWLTENWGEEEERKEGRKDGRPNIASKENWSEMCLARRAGFRLKQRSKE